MRQFILFFCVIFLLFEKTMRNIFFKNKLFSLCFILTFIVIIAPNIIWNINNNWVTFEHTADNAALDRSGLHFFESLKFVGSQIIMVGPLIFLFFIFGFVKNLLMILTQDFFLSFLCQYLSLYWLKAFWLELTLIGLRFL